MATTPVGLDFRSAALARVLSARQQMDKVLVEISEGSRSIVSVLNGSDDEALGRIYVVKVIESFGDIGKVRARQVLDELEISHKKRTADLAVNERDALVKKFQ